MISSILDSASVAFQQVCSMIGDHAVYSKATARLEVVLTKLYVTRALIRLALEFRTWELLAHHGRADGNIARLLVSAVVSVPRTAHVAAR
jgi:hypothetical protein